MKSTIDVIKQNNLIILVKIWGGRKVITVFSTNAGYQKDLIKTTHFFISMIIDFCKCANTEHNLTLIREMLDLLEVFYSMYWERKYAWGNPLLHFWLENTEFLPTWSTFEYQFISSSNIKVNGGSCSVEWT